MGLLRLFILFILASTALRFLVNFVNNLPATRRATGPGPRQNMPPRPAQPRAPTPHEVLGVSPMATPQEIKAAYQTLVKQYHPDKIADMGVELRDLAERRTKEINAAYSQLKRS